MGYGTKNNEDSAPVEKQTAEPKPGDMGYSQISQYRKSLPLTSMGTKDDIAYMEKYKDSIVSKVGEAKYKELLDKLKESK